MALAAFLGTGAIVVILAGAGAPIPSAELAQRVAGEPKIVKVPSIVGLDYHSAQQRLAGSSLTGLAAADGGVCHSRHRARWDLVVAQLPTPGVPAYRGSTVTMYEAGGRPC